MEPVHPRHGSAALKTEDALHLVPHREHEEDGQADEESEGDHEAESCARLLALASQLRVPPRAVVVVGPVDRLWVDRRGWRGDDAASGLGHPGSLDPLPGCFDHTFSGSGR